MRGLTNPSIRALLGALALGSAFSGCTLALPYRARNPLAEGLIGKTWRTEVVVDASLVDTSGVSNQPIVRHWDLKPLGSAAIASASLWDRLSGNYRSFGLRYADSSGWDSPGSSFGEVGFLSGGNDLGMTFLAPWGTQGVLSVGYRDASSIVMTSQGSGSSAATWNWQAPIETTLATGTDFPAWNATDDLTAGTPIASAQDLVGRMTLAIVDGTGSFRAALWRSAAAAPISSAFSFTVSSAAVTAATPVALTFDGSSLVCATYHLSTFSPGVDLTLSCRDPDNAITVWTAETQVSGLAGVTTSHAAASDDDDTIWVVVMVENGGTTHPYATQITAGAWSGSVTQLDAAMPQAYANYTSGTAPGTAPAIAHLGDGAFQAVWLGADSSARVSKLFSAVYTPDTGTWSDAVEVSDTEESFTAVAHQRSFTLFSNPTYRPLQSGLAINWVAVEATDVRQTHVARFDYFEGWVLPATYGTGCDPLGGALLAPCSLRPQGAVLPTGNTVVLFADVDSSGNTRLKSADLR